MERKNPTRNSKPRTLRCRICGNLGYFAAGDSLIKTCSKCKMESLFQDPSEDFTMTLNPNDVVFIVQNLREVFCQPNSDIDAHAAAHTIMVKLLDGCPKKLVAEPEGNNQELDVDSMVELMEALGMKVIVLKEDSFDPRNN